MSSANLPVFTGHRQLSKLPKGVPGFSRAVIDSPREADTYETKLRDGDIVIAYVSRVMIWFMAQVG